MESMSNMLLYLIVSQDVPSLVIIILLVSVMNIK